MRTWKEIDTRVGAVRRKTGYQSEEEEEEEEEKVQAGLEKKGRKKGKGKEGVLKGRTKEWRGESDSSDSTRFLSDVSIWMAFLCVSGLFVFYVFVLKMLKCFCTPISKENRGQVKKRC